MVEKPVMAERAVREHVPGTSWNQARQWIRGGKLRVNGVPLTDPQVFVRPGDHLTLHMTAPRSNKAGLDAKLGSDAIVYLDRHVVVVRKPAGISSVPFDEDERDALSQLVRARLRQLQPGRPAPPLGIVHRIDKETSGLLVFARTLQAKRHLEQQLRQHTVRRRYLALATGRVQPGRYESRLVKDRGDGLRGSTTNPKLGRAAVTHVEVLEDFAVPVGTVQAAGPRQLQHITLIECRLETGRTHQIRIHLSERGHPLLGERVYTRDHPAVPAPRLLLHAAELGFVHPATAREVLFEEPPPRDFLDTLNALRAQDHRQP